MRFIAGAFVLLAVMAASGVSEAQQRVAAVQQMQPEQTWPQDAELKGDYPRGAIVINITERRLYYSLGDGKALVYRVAVGKTGFGWTGQSWVSQKTKNPAWYPTARMQAEGAPDYVPPGPQNPLGVRALYLGSSMYRIHGTDAPWTIGEAVSKGCIRMYNEDVLDLYPRVPIGTRVTVTWRKYTT